jgi:DNA modification methylase
MSSFLEIESKAGTCFHTQGDSTTRLCYEKVLGRHKAQLLLADPPYCLLKRRNKKTGQLRDPKTAKINHPNVTRYENIKEYTAFTKSWLELAVQFLEDKAPLIIWTNFLGKDPIRKVANDLGYSFFLGEYQWCKLTQKKNSGNEIMARLYEVALIFSKIAPPTLDNSSSALAESVVSYYDENDSTSKWENHPNHKIFKVIEPLIRNYSKPMDRILDPFCGSGSTAEAAIKLGRSFSAIELDQKWTEVTHRRLSEFES